MLDFRLESFLSVCDTMNYRKSAEILHVSQPAITHHIQFLERNYGCRLFQYENKRLRKTREAVILEQYARTMKVNEVNMVRMLNKDQITELNIGATKTIGECVISSYVEKFVTSGNNEVSLVVDNTQHLLNQLDNCRLDFALIEGSFDRKKYGYSLFSKEPFVGICGENHPFKGREVKISELFNETLICREEGSGTRAILENKLLDFNESISHFKRRLCISSFPIILDYVKKGIGISFVYEVLARRGGVASFTLENCSIEKEFNFVYLKGTGAEKKIQRFLQEEK